MKKKKNHKKSFIHQETRSLHVQVFKKKKERKNSQAGFCEVITVSKLTG